MSQERQPAGGTLRTLIGSVTGAVPLLLLAVTEGAAAAALHSDPVLEEIVVVATKTATPRWTVPALVTTLDRGRLDWEQISSLGQIARYEPALEVDTGTPRFGDSGISIRAIGGNRVALELDGAPLPQRYAIGSFADSSRLAVDPAIIRRVEILRGPASALYGSDAIGGVITMTTVDGRNLVEAGRRVYLGAGGGYFGEDDGLSIHGTWAASADRDSALLSVSHHDSDAPDNQARGVPDDRVDASRWQAFGKWTHDFDRAGTLRVSVDHYRTDTGSDVRSVIGFDRFVNTVRITGDDRQRRTRTVAAWEMPELPLLDEGHLTVYWQQSRTNQDTDERRFTGPAAVLLERDFEMDERGYGGELRLRRDFESGPLAHVVMAGVEWDHLRLLERRDGRQTTLATGAVTNVLLGEVFPLRDLPRSSVDEIGLYLQDEIHYGRFSLIPGLRWDNFDLDARTDSVFADPARLTDLQTDRLSLRVGATLEIAPGLILFAQYAEGFRAPPPEDINLFLDIPLFNFRAVPNPDLKAETSHNLEGGFRLGHDGTWVEASAYHSSYDDFIESRALIGVDPVTGGLLFQSRNIDETTIYGAEVQFEQELGGLHAALTDWRFQAGMHWARGDNDVAGMPLNGVNPLKAVFNLYWEPGRWPLRAGLRVQHFAEQDRVDFSSGPFFVPPAATTVDATLRWTPAPWLVTHLGVNNLTDARYWRFADVRRHAPGDPRIEVASRPGIHANLTFELRY